MNGDAPSPAPSRRTAGDPLHALTRGGAVVGVAVLLGCALVTVTDIVGRRVAGWSLPGLIDLTQLLVMTSMFLCIPYAFRRRAHVDVDLVHRQLPRRVRLGLDVLWSLLSAGFLVAIVWHAGRAALQVREYGELSPTLALPMVWYWVPILVGATLSALVCVVQATRPGDNADRPSDSHDPSDAAPAARATDFSEPR